MTRVEGWRYDLAFLARWAKLKTYHPFRTNTGDRFVSNALYTEAEFDGLVGELDRAIPSMSDVQIELGMMRLTESLGDGHTELAGARRLEYAQTLPVSSRSFKKACSSRLAILRIAAWWVRRCSDSTATAPRASWPRSHRTSAATTTTG